MKKKIILILSVLIALSSILFINLGNKSTAQECNDCTPIPTPPGDSDYSKINCECSDAIPTIKASASTIAPGGSITLWVDSGGLACPDFTWSVSSAKYTLNKSKTTNDLETVTMTAASGTCSSGYNDNNIYVTVNVTDNCGQNKKMNIRNTSGNWGAWITQETQGTDWTDGYKIEAENIVENKYLYRFVIANNCTWDGTNYLSCNESYGIALMNLAASPYGFNGLPMNDATNFRTYTKIACHSSGTLLSCNNNFPGKVEVYITQNGVKYVHYLVGAALQRRTWECP